MDLAALAEDLDVFGVLVASKVEECWLVTIDSSALLTKISPGGNWNVLVPSLQSDGAHAHVVLEASIHGHIPQ